MWQDSPTALNTGGYLLIIGATLSLAWWRTAPLVSLAGSVLFASAYLVMGFPFGPIQVCVVLATAATAYRRPPAQSAIVCGIAAAVFTASVIPRLGDTRALPGVLAWAGWLIIPWFAGTLLQVRVAAASRSRQELVKRAALTERIRLAQDIHDAAGHGLAVIALQAGVAQLVFDEQPEQARASLRAIDETSRAALQELRETLAAVADPDGSITPERDAIRRLGLEQIPGLVGRVRGAGLAVELDVADDLPVLSERHHAVIYRMVQEALTNVLQHAEADSATVAIAHGDGAVTVRVTDDGRGSGANPGTGRGLVGMRARVESLAGELEAGPVEPKGFVVCAHLPVTLPDETGETP